MTIAFCNPVQDRNPENIKDSHLLALLNWIWRYLGANVSQTPNKWPTCWISVASGSTRPPLLFAGLKESMRNWTFSWQIKNSGLFLSPRQGWGMRNVNASLLIILINSIQFQNHQLVEPSLLVEFQLHLVGPILSNDNNQIIQFGIVEVEIY